MSKPGLIPHSTRCKGEGVAESVAAARSSRGARQYDTRAMSPDAGSTPAVDVPARRSYNRRNLVASR